MTMNCISPMIFVWRKDLARKVLIIVLLTFNLDHSPGARAQQTSESYTQQESGRYASSPVLSSQDQDTLLQALGAMRQEMSQMSGQLENLKQELRLSAQNTKQELGLERTNVDRETTANKYCSKGLSGIYSVTPRHIGEHPFDVYCDMNTTAEGGGGGGVGGGGGWLVFQRRINGKVDFYRNWENYKNGFGDLDGEFWLGNDKLYRLTSYGSFRLRVELENFKGERRYAEYEHFRIGSETDQYKMSFYGYYGDAGDSLVYHKDMLFTTFDKDNDKGPVNCASVYTGAWWYNHCHSVNLNGRYNASENRGPRWSDFSSDNPLKFTEMKIKEIGLDES